MSERPTHRICRKCGEEKELEKFVAMKSCRWGRMWICNECKYEQDRARLAAMDMSGAPESRVCRRCGERKLLEQFERNSGGRWGRGHRCRACMSTKATQWNVANRERRLSIQRRHNAALWREAPEARRTRSFETQSRLRGARVVDRVVPLVVLERDDGVCGICGDDVDPFDYHIDHIDPCQDGGDHSYDNVQLAHPGCNTTKSNAHRKLKAAA